MIKNLNSTKENPSTIVFINQSSGYLMIDIVNVFEGFYEKRVLITGLINSRNTELDKNVRLVKMMTYKRSSLINRLLSWPIGFMQALFYVKLKYRTAHLFLVSNPPFIPLLPLFCKNPFSLLIYDVYPNIIYENGYLSEKSPFIRFWKKANLRVFSRAQHIYTLTEGMKEVVSEYTDRPINVVPIWTDNSFLGPIAKEGNRFLKDNGLQGKFIVLYSGNIGDSQNVEVIIELASKIKNDNLMFIIVGQGTHKRKIQHLVESRNLKNCSIFPWQNNEVFAHVLASADIAVVSLGEKNSQLGIPSKFYNYLSVGAPIMSISGKSSDLEKIVHRYEVGKSFLPNKLNEMCDFIEDLYKFPEKKAFYANNSLKASLDFKPDNANQFLITSTSNY